jgi:hypothetical protein
MNYTLRNVPRAVDAELRRRAKAEGKSLNTVAIEALIRGSGLGETPIRHRDLSDIAGTWQEDPDFDQAITDQDQIDEETAYLLRSPRNARRLIEAIAELERGDGSERELAE